MSTFSPESRATSSGVMDSRPLSKPLKTAQGRDGVLALEGGLERVLGIGTVGDIGLVVLVEAEYGFLADYGDAVLQGSGEAVGDALVVGPELQGESRTGKAQGQRIVTLLDTCLPVQRSVYGVTDGRGPEAYG